MPDYEQAGSDNFATGLPIRYKLNPRQKCEMSDDIVVMGRGTVARERPERPMRTASELIGTAASLRRDSMRLPTAPSSTASQYSMTPSAKVLASQTKIFSAGMLQIQYSPSFILPGKTLCLILQIALWPGLRINLYMPLLERLYSSLWSSCFLSMIGPGGS